MSIIGKQCIQHKKMVQLTETKNTIKTVHL